MQRWRPGAQSGVTPLSVRQHVVLFRVTAKTGRIIMMFTEEGKRLRVGAAS